MTGYKTVVVTAFVRGGEIVFLSYYRLLYANHLPGA
jgi:hypothetical protein